MWRVIVTGEGHHYASTSELVLAAACAVLNIGWDVEAFLVLLEAEGSALAEAYADRVERRGADATDWWLRSQIWPAAEGRVSDSPAIGVHDAERLSAMRVWALSRPWPGKGGAAEQAVYLALIDKASLTARLEFNASFRELAERAGISGVSTVDRALKALRSNGLVQISTTPTGKQDDDPPEFRSPTTWELRWLEEMSTHLGQAVSVADFPALLSHDLWRNKVGLGKSASRLYVALMMAPATPGELAERLGLKAASVRRRLHTLAANGLAVRGQHGRWHHQEADFDELAEQLGASGRGERQRQQHQTQRDGYDRIMKVGIRAVRPRIDDQTWPLGHPLSPGVEPTQPPAHSLLGTRHSYTPHQQGHVPSCAHPREARGEQTTTST